MAKKKKKSWKKKKVYNHHNWRQSKDGINGGEPSAPAEVAWRPKVDYLLREEALKHVNEVGLTNKVIIIYACY